MYMLTLNDWPFLFTVCLKDMLFSISFLINKFFCRYWCLQLLTLSSINRKWDELLLSPFSSRMIETFGQRAVSLLAFTTYSSKHHHHYHNKPIIVHNWTWASTNSYHFMLKFLWAVAHPAFAKCLSQVVTPPIRKANYPTLAELQSHWRTRLPRWLSILGLRICF